MPPLNAQIAPRISSQGLLQWTHPTRNLASRLLVLPKDSISTSDEVFEDTLICCQTALPCPNTSSRTVRSFSTSDVRPALFSEKYGARTVIGAPTQDISA